MTNLLKLVCDPGFGFIQHIVRLQQEPSHPAVVDDKLYIQCLHQRIGVQPMQETRLDQQQRARNDWQILFSKANTSGTGNEVDHLKVLMLMLDQPPMRLVIVARSPKHLYPGTAEPPRQIISGDPMHAKQISTKSLMLKRTAVSVYGNHPGVSRNDSAAGTQYTEGRRYP
jgi:hypothetical protein